MRIDSRLKYDSCNHLLFLNKFRVRKMAASFVTCNTCGTQYLAPKPHEPCFQTQKDSFQDSLYLAFTFKQNSKLQELSVCDSEEEARKDMHDMMIEEAIDVYPTQDILNTQHNLKCNYQLQTVSQANFLFGLTKIEKSNKFMLIQYSSEKNPQSIFFLSNSETGDELAKNLIVQSRNNQDVNQLWKKSLEKSEEPGYYSLRQLSFCIEPCIELFVLDG